MKIAFNPSTVAALTTPPNNKDITFDLRGRNIFARGVKFYGTDTNTWRDIKINNVSIGSHTLDLQNGSNTTLTNTNGIVTINSTWRPIVDNLTSDSTTSSLSAKQGKVLKALIDGKSNSDHNHDGRYLRLTGGWMSGDINFGGDNKIYWGRNTDSASISFKNDGDGDANSYMSFVTSDNGNEYFRWSHSSGSTNTEWMALRSDGLRVRGTKVSLEGHSHNDLYYTKAESNAKYITDITTSVNKLTFTRNGSNIIRDITVNVVHSQGHLTNIPNKDATTKASPGLLIYDSYEQTIGTNSYSSVLSINTGGTIQIAGNWGDYHARNLYWRSQSDRNVADYPWKSWRTILDSENYSSTLDSRYYTESEVNSLLDAKLNRQNLSYGNWNPRGYHLAADYHYNGGDLSISESGGKIHVSVDGYFWQNEGQYRVLDTSDVAGLKSNLTVHQYLSATDAAWYPLVWGGNAHLNTSDSTGAVYKSYDKLSWQTSSQTLYATNIQTNNIKNLSIGGGIYWNPYVESASNGNDAASITLVRSGVAGGTTLVLSQMNDTNDTIQFKTNTAARLYHNSYPILTTQNTYVSNNKGYINGTEITQVNNSDKLDGVHLNGIFTGFSYAQSRLTATIGTVSKTVNVTGSYPSIRGVTMNTIASYGNCMGMADLASSNSNVNPNNQTSWHHFINMSYNTESTNMWQTQFAIKAGTTEVWVRSRAGGSISDSSAWAAPWVRLARITDNIASATNADMVDGYHENSFLRYRGATYTDQEATLWSQIGIKQYGNALPDNLTGVYNYGSVISLPGFNSRFEIYASHQSSNGNGLYYRSGWGNDKKAWLKFIDSSNIGSQSVNYANSAGHANSAGNADTLGGIPRNYGQAPFGTIPSIGNDGVMEIGRYIDFHSDNSGSYDYSTRIQATGNYKNTVNLPSASGTLALTSYGGDDSTPIFLGCLDLYHGGDGTISSSFYCLGHSVSFTYTRGGNYCNIVIPDTTRLSFYIIAATASVNYSGGGMDTWTGYHRGSGAWWLHCYAFGWNEVRVKGFCQANKNIDSWWGGNPLWNNEYGANRITVCIFGYVKYR